MDHQGQQKVPVEVEIRYVRQASEPAQYAWVWLLAEPCDKQEIVNEAGLEPIFFDGLAKGLRSVLGSRKFKIVLTRAKTHPIDSGASSFQRAGAQAAEVVLERYADLNSAEE
jgi:hypothetical protein